jgi:hypothetical protein
MTTTRKTSKTPSKAELIRRLNALLPLVQGPRNVNRTSSADDAARGYIEARLSQAEALIAEIKRSLRA